MKTRLAYSSAGLFFFEMWPQKTARRKSYTPVSTSEARRLRRQPFPSGRHLDKGPLYTRPFVERRGIQVGTIWPNQRANFGIQRYLIELP